MTYRLIDFDTDTFRLERELNQAEREGYTLAQIVAGNPGRFSLEGDLIDGTWQPTVMIMHRPEPATSPVLAVMSLIDAMDDAQRAALIDALPDAIIDPICERCDTPDQEQTISTTTFYTRNLFHPSTPTTFHFEDKNHD